MFAVKNRKISEFFNALSHPVRVEIVTELLKGTKCVSDIKELVNVNQPNVSQHLSVLKTSGIVNWQQEGKRRCYFLMDPQVIKGILNVLEKTKLVKPKKD
ncbi:MAG: metalloregulator ArsR/SmtB family transcription factor [Candidatus Omnitrophica bacterium]|nr:metalloregulator ArsR/SmtB family transcription factor [Candidatus Omnitrophota bacterium]MDD5429877.1 metalloregulator ArsR/SmtB family transcription factor [Candidatus Omnitrophota bacterium]